MSTKRSRLRKRFLIATLVAIPIAPLAILGVHILTVKNQPLKKSLVPAMAFELHPELEYAVKRYQAEGNRYRWGPNDCSTFVTDYMRACGKPAFVRLTTEGLYNTATMDWHGFQQVKVKDLRPGDIIVFRYTGRYNTLEGHTGIVISDGKKEYVAHNSLSFGGLNVESVPAFMATANRVADKNNGVKMIKVFTRKDYESWNKKFELRFNGQG